MRTDAARRLNKVRELMHNDNMDYYIIPSEDAHQSERVAYSDRRLEYISGFAGPSGHAIVSRNSAYLVTDSRFSHLAHEQLDPHWVLVQVGGIQGPNDWIEWLAAKARRSRIGVDARMISCENATRLAAKLGPLDSRLIHPPQNLVDLAWSDKPSKSRERIYRLPIELTGEEAASKLHRLRQWISVQPPSAGNFSVPEMHEGTLITSLSAIAYLLNLRGSDLLFDPVLHAYFFVGLQTAVLFINMSKVDEDVAWYLQSLSVQRRDYTDVWRFLRQREWGTGKVLITPETSFAISLMLTRFRYTVAPSFVEEMMAFKNETEIEGLRRAHLRDGLSYVRFLAWLDEKLSVGYNITEYEAAQRLNEFRRLDEHYLRPTYENISATGPNAALPHYSPGRTTARMIDRESPYLSHSGGYYQGGRCDTARTLHFGRPTTEHIDAFTRVLRGHIAVDKAVIQGASSSFLEVLAQQAFFRDITSNSVCTFYFDSIIMHSSCGQEWHRARIPSFRGRILPHQRGGRWGLRIKSTLTVQRAPGPNGAEWLRFERLTNVPIQTRMVKNNMLTKEERQWLKAHNGRCFDLLAPHLKEDKRALNWLKRET
ncbi:peptidase M24, structural domain-containing protein [Mycena maculata]|uniref:Peptidase M24, structural domain-containing protein n=1 Tax=Mycena maculata TaxID=230809 RepID=A0AAD7N346_9AGAR|nr:peptidase M24, structural domain-containing protein [Mycena maculata]